MIHKKQRNGKIKVAIRKRGKAQARRKYCLKKEQVQGAVDLKFLD
jgi:hypothetical protein